MKIFLTVLTSGLSLELARWRVAPLTYVALTFLKEHAEEQELF